MDDVDNHLYNYYTLMYGYAFITYYNKHYDEILNNQHINFDELENQFEIINKQNSYLVVLQHRFNLKTKLSTFLMEKQLEGNILFNHYHFLFQSMKPNKFLIELNHQYGMCVFLFYKLFKNKI